MTIKNTRQLHAILVLGNTRLSIRTLRLCVIIFVNLIEPLLRIEHATEQKDVGEMARMDMRRGGVDSQHVALEFIVEEGAGSDF